LKRAVSINGITFNYPLFSSEEYEAKDYIGTKTLTTGGRYNIKIQNKGSLTKEVMFSSGESAFIQEEIKNRLLGDVDLNAKNVIFTDGREQIYYYNHNSNAITFTPLYEGSMWYKVEINLLKG